MYGGAQPFIAPKEQNLNSPGFQPRVARTLRMPSPEGPTCWWDLLLAVFPAHPSA